MASVAPTATVTPTAAPPSVTPTPQPTPQLVKAITLVANVGLPADATPAGLAWHGIQAAAAEIGASAKVAAPANPSQIASLVEAASGPDEAVVVTVGPDAAASVAAAAAAHPATQYVELGVAAAGGAPANVHGVVFDEAETGYLAGFVAAAFSTTRRIAFVGDSKTDVATANYAAGFRNGAQQVTGGVAANVGYAGTAYAPEKGRAAAAALVKGGADVVVALPDISGIAAMRQACGAGAKLVALEGDAWALVPDVQKCLIASAVQRYDVAVGNALDVLASGAQLPVLTVETVATGAITVTEFHVAMPEGFQSNLDGILAAMKNPPRPTPTPSATPSPKASPAASQSAGSGASSKP